MGWSLFIKPFVWSMCFVAGTCAYTSTSLNSNKWNIKCLKIWYTNNGQCPLDCCIIHWERYKMGDILQTTYSNTISWLKSCCLEISPWAKTQIFTYRYHLGGQNFVMFFMYTYAQCIIQAMIDLWTWQLSCGYHQCWLFYFSKNNIYFFPVIFNLYPK